MSFSRFPLHPTDFQSAPLPRFLLATQSHPQSKGGETVCPCLLRE